MSRVSQRAIERASSRADEDPYFDEPHRPDEALAHLRREAWRLGVRLVEKPPTDGPLARASTALRRVVLLRNGFWDLPVRDQVRRLAHELRHVRLWARLGRRAILRYLFRAPFRWSTEVQASAEGIRALASIGFRGGLLDQAADAATEHICGWYVLGRLRGKKAATREILRATARRAEEILDG